MRRSWLPGAPVTAVGEYDALLLATVHAIAKVELLDAIVIRRTHGNRHLLDARHLRVATRRVDEDGGRMIG